MTSRAFWSLIFLPALIKLVCSFFIELNNDEVYYWTYALNLQGNYFDHPPGIALLIKLFTANLFFQQVFFLRLGPVICSTIATFIVYRIGNRMGGAKVAFLSAMLFVINPYCSFVAGMLVLPDAPMLLFWLVCVDLAQSALSIKSGSKNRDILILFFGLFAGFCMMSKMHGAFLWVGFLLFIWRYHRRLLFGTPLLYAISLTVLSLIPFLLWNIDHAFITYTFHGSRITGTQLHLDYFSREIVGELIYNNPIVVFLIVFSVYVWFRYARFQKDKSAIILLFFSWPLLFFVWGLSFFNETLPHWTGVSFATLVPFAAQTLVRWSEVEMPSIRKKHFISRWRTASIVYILLFITIVLFSLNFLPPFGSGNAKKLGKNDVTLDMSGWEKFGKDFDSLVKANSNKASKVDPSFIISDNWFPAAHLEYYVARKLNWKLFAIGNINAIHHYAWRNDSKSLPSTGTDAYFITVSNYFQKPSDDIVTCFKNMEPPVFIPQFRSGKKVRYFLVYKLIYFKGRLPAYSFYGSFNYVKF